MNIVRRLVRDRKYRNYILRRLTEETQRAARPPISADASSGDREFLTTQSMLIEIMLMPVIQTAELVITLLKQLTLH